MSTAPHASMIALRRKGSAGWAYAISNGPTKSAHELPTKPTQVQAPMALPRASVGKSSTVKVLSVDHTISVAL